MGFRSVDRWESLMLDVSGYMPMNVTSLPLFRQRRERRTCGMTRCQITCRRILANGGEQTDVPHGAIEVIGTAPADPPNAGVARNLLVNTC